MSRHPHLLPYGAAHLGKSLCWACIDLLAIYFLIAELQLPAVTAGLVLMLLTALNAVSDLAVAVALQGRGASARVAGQLQLVGSVLVGIALLLAFSKGPGAANSPLLYALVTGGILRVAYALLDVPQNALMSILTRDTAGSLAFANVRALLSGLSRLAVAAASFWLISGDELQEVRFAHVTFVFAILMAIGASALWASTRRVDETTATQPRRSGLALPSSAPWLLAAAFAHALGVSAMSRLLPFAGDVVSHDRAGPAALVLFATGCSLAPPLWHMIAGRRSPLVAFSLAAGLTILSTAALAVSNLMLSALWVVLYGAAFAGATVLIWAGLADSIHDHYVRTGVRDDAAAFATLTFVTKLGIAVAGSLTGILISHLLADPIAGLREAAAVCSVGALVAWICYWRAMDPVLPDIDEAHSHSQGRGGSV